MNFTGVEGSQGRHGPRGLTIIGAPSILAALILRAYREHYVVVNRRTVLSGMLFLGAIGLTLPVAAQPQDATLESTVRLLRKTVVATRQTPLSDPSNGEASQVLTALRSSKDPDLLPVFEKMAESKADDNRLFGIVAATILTKDSSKMDVTVLLTSQNRAMAGAALASLIDVGLLTNEQLTKFMNGTTDGANRAMAAGELNHRKQLKDRNVLKELLKDSNDYVRYYAAVTMLDSSDPADVATAQGALSGMTDKHNLRNLEVEALMLVRAQKENISAAIPWAARIAADEKADEGLRYTAVSMVLGLKGPEGPRVLSDMINRQRETIQQVKLGLISLEYADQLKPAMLDPLVKSRSALASTIGTLARKGAEGSDTTGGVINIIKDGHPIVLNWALAYADRTDGDRRLMIRTAVVNQATIVDKVRGEDFVRATDAAQKILEEDGVAGRKTMMNLLRSDNRAVVEATLAGIYRSKAENQAELVMPIWDGLIRTTSTESSANYAALILAREGHAEPKDWFPGMVAGGTVQVPGFRVLAGWYYAKLKGQSRELLRAALAD